MPVIRVDDLENRKQRGEDIVKVRYPVHDVSAIGDIVGCQANVRVLIIVSAVIAVWANEVAQARLWTHSLKLGTVRISPKSSISRIAWVSADVVELPAVLMKTHSGEEDEHVDEESSHVCEIGQRLNQGANQLFHAYFVTH